MIFIERQLFSAVETWPLVERVEEDACPGKQVQVKAGNTKHIGRKWDQSGGYQAGFAKDFTFIGLEAFLTTELIEGMRA